MIGEIDMLESQVVMYREPSYFTFILGYGTVLWIVLKTLMEMGVYAE